MTVPSTGPPDRKRCRLSETDLSNARSLFAKQQRQKEEKNHRRPRLQLIYIYSLATTAWPGLRVQFARSHNGARGVRDLAERQSERHAIDAIAEDTRVNEGNTRETLLHRDPRRLISQRREPRRVVLDLRTRDDVPKLPPPEPRLQEVRLDARALPLIRR